MIVLFIYLFKNGSKQSYILSWFNNTMNHKYGII